SASSSPPRTGSPRVIWTSSSPRPAVAGSRSAWWSRRRRSGVPQRRRRSASSRCRCAGSGWRSSSSHGSTGPRSIRRHPRRCPSPVRRICARLSARRWMGWPRGRLSPQALGEWANKSAGGVTALAVCPDAKASRSRRSSQDSAEIAVVGLALPATTDPARLAQRMKEARTDGEGMRVVFATYQSIDVVAQAQQLAGLEPFDLVICDEAHRTTGATLAGTEESAFVRVHDGDYLKADKRLYMTATPRIYDDASKAKAGKAQAVLASMDDE